MKVDASSSPEIYRRRRANRATFWRTQRTRLEGLVRCNRSTRKQFTHPNRPRNSCPSRGCRNTSSRPHRTHHADRSSDGNPAAPPAGVRLKLVGDLAGWQRRGQIIAGYDPGIKLGGKCDLQIQGLADKQHVEVATAPGWPNPLRSKETGSPSLSPKCKVSSMVESTHKISVDCKSIS